MSYTVEYTVSEVFTTSEGVVALNALVAEIEASSLILTMLDKSENAGVYLDYDGGVQKCYITFKIQPSGDELTALLAVCNAHSGEEVFDPVTSDGRPIVALQGEQEDAAIPVSLRPPIGDDIEAFSHNFCDPTTWWTNSKLVENEELTTSDNLTFSTVHTNLLNVYSGKVTSEKNLWPDYLPVVKVDDVEKTMHNPFTGTGGDYSIDNENGTITFDEEQTGTVTMTYHWVDLNEENCSAWEIVAGEGEALYVDGGRVVISPSDWDITTYVVYEILIGDTVVGYSRYDTLDQLYDSAGSCLAAVDESIGGVTRGIVGARKAFSLEYETTRNIYGVPLAPQPMKLRVRLGDDIPFGGTRFTVKLTGHVRQF